MAIFRLSLVLLSFFISTTLNLPLSNGFNLLRDPKFDGCSALHDYPDSQSRCTYIKSNLDCRPKGYINSIEIFYCTFGTIPLFGYTILLFWLVLLFYMLANTASEYFCPSLESLSRVLKLSPTIAGTTLLPLGNGATDVFASFVSFTRSGDGDVGLNSILGGAFFVSTVVVGVICIVISPRHMMVDKRSFIRDVFFFIFSLLSLLMIIFIGRISFWGSICFSSIYILYICAVWAMHLFSVRDKVVNCEAGVPLQGCVDEEKPDFIEKNDDQKRKSFFDFDPMMYHYWGLFLYALELPIYLPRRLTIPMVSEEKWSKPFAVLSVTLAPILLATLWNTQREKVGSKTSLVIYMTSILIGSVFGNVAFEATKRSTPPNKCLLPWFVGGFLMSVTWTYVIAEELVSLLVSIGVILGISPSILGLTVLAWGNSIGDLIANVAMATHGGPDGAQIAISGCYAGPVFNMLVGLGMSLIFSSWAEYPSSYVIQGDPFLYEDIGFLICGLLWALVVFPKKNMRPDRYLGSGLLVIYSCFLFVKLVRALGLLKSHGCHLY
ncbi:hypothetical protein LguiA_024464 [Lonicera macranthoides]